MSFWQFCGDNRKRKRVLRLIELTAEDTEYFEIKILDWEFVYKKTLWLLQANWLEPLAHFHSSHDAIKPFLP